MFELKTMKKKKAIKKAVKGVGCHMESTTMATPISPDDIVAYKRTALDGILSDVYDAGKKAGEKKKAVEIHCNHISVPLQSPVEPFEPFIQPYYYMTSCGIAESNGCTTICANYSGKIIPDNA